MLTQCAVHLYEQLHQCAQDAHSVCSSPTRDKRALGPCRRCSATRGSSTSPPFPHSLITIPSSLATSPLSGNFAFSCHPSQLTSSGQWPMARILKTFRLGQLVDICARRTVTDLSCSLSCSHVCRFHPRPHENQHLSCVRRATGESTGGEKRSNRSFILDHPPVSAFSLSGQPWAQLVCHVS